jgi:hypothetical protein
MIFKRLSEEDMELVQKFLKTYGGVIKTVNQSGYLESTFPLESNNFDLDDVFNEFNPQKELGKKLILNLDFMLVSVPDNINTFSQEKLKEITVRLKRLYFATYGQSIYD